MSTKMAPFEVTKAQRAWLEKEKAKTSESFATIIRKLLQDKVDKKGK
jgi:hypothetical protein